MSYTNKNGTPMSRQQAMNDSTRRQAEAMRTARTSAERCAIQRQGAAERQNIFKTYKGK